MSWNADESAQIARMEVKLDLLLSHEPRIKSLERARAIATGAIFVIVAAVAAFRDAIIAVIWSRY